MPTPSESYARFRREQDAPVFADFAQMYDFTLDDFQVRACKELEAGRGVLVAAPTGSGKTLVGEFAVHLALSAGPQVLLHHTDQGALQPEVRRPGPPLRRRQGRPAHRRQHDQRRGADRRDDHRGAAQHALRRLLDAGRARVRGDGRGALPRGPVPRRGVGGGDHPPARVGGAGLAVRDRVQRRGVRRVAGHRPRRDLDDRRGAPAGAAVPARDGRPEDLRPVPKDEDGSVNPDLVRIARDDWRSARTRDHRSKRGAPRNRAGARGQGARRDLLPSRYDVVERLDSAGLLPAIVLRVQPGRLRRRGHPVPQRQPRADHPRGARRDPRLRRGAAAATSPTRTCTSSATTTSSRG